MNPKTQVVSVTLTFTVEDVDGRVTKEDWRDALYRAFDIRDGRQDFSTEALGDAAYRVVSNVAAGVVSVMGYRRAEKYPGLRDKPWKFVESLPSPKIVPRSYVSATVEVDGVEFDTNELY